MRWTPGNRGNVQDVRGGAAAGYGMPLGIGGVVILLIGSWLTGVNLFDVVGGGGAATDVVAERPADSSPEEEQLVDFVDAVMGDIQHTWSSKIGNYQPTRAGLFRDSIQSACGLSSAATGPVLLSGRSQGLSRFELLRRSPSEARRAGRFRASLRAGARSWTSRAEPHRHARECAVHRQRERAFGARRAAGRLLCRSLGTRGGQTGPVRGGPRRAGSGRRRRRAERRGGHRRRPPSAEIAGPCRAGIVHARQLGTAGVVVQARNGNRRSARLRHVRRGYSIISTR